MNRIAKPSARARTSSRQRWMSVLATAPPRELEEAWERLGQRPGYAFVRRPEIGLVLVRGRAGGTGMRFNFGELPVTRCSVRLADGTVGHAYVGGRSPRHAEIAAVLDALLQKGEGRDDLETRVVAPLAERREARRRAALSRSQPTRVEFFTLVRGEE
jgi:alpha-D-ribose 1-methylphosphonate 5-triphosphate synthase subunit PhnG